ncbi:MAG: Na/Pi cotransporter family protein [Candidatus Omnitrophica bacterium]|nr:Na/Pi cotransporter family protein [Candidatus Omnitrophota bacterium]
MKEVVFGLFGGLGLFIFGMKYLSDGLQRVAGTKLRRTLRSLTDNRVRGTMLGAFVTCLIQSSSVTTVMLVGLVNAGIVNLTQAASVVIGANIGTTITAQVIAFKISKYALPAIGIGMVMMLASRKKRMQFWGQVILAFGLVFLGLTTMSGVMKPLKDVPAVTEFFVSLSYNPVYCILLGVFFTVAVQSSSASIGMVLALAGVGLIDFQTSLYIVLGDNVGTTITAWLASIGGSISAKRMACFHTFFNIIGVTYFALLIKSGFYPSFIDTITPGEVTTETIARHIANGHTFFNVINAVIFLFILGPVVKLTRFLIPGKDIYVSTEFKYLQDKLLDTPEIAIDSAKKELVAMSEMVKNTINTAVNGFLNKDKRSVAHVQTQESAIDSLQHDITFYLAKLSSKNLTPELGGQLPPLLHAINDIERISDHAVNIAELTEKVISDQLEFTNNAQAEMRMMFAKVEEMFEQTVKAVQFSDKNAVSRVMRYEGEINTMHAMYLSEHTQRLCNRKCSPMSALVFVEYINNLEKMADHLTNVAQASSGGFSFEDMADM